MITDPTDPADPATPTDEAPVWEFDIPSYPELVKWNMENVFYPMIDPRTDPNVDYHRLQLEYWLWRQAALFPFPLLGPILDIGAEYRRNFDPKFRDSLLTVNNTSYDTPYGTCAPDVLDDVQVLSNFHSNQASVIICTETIEHVPDPFLAVRQMARVLQPGGLLLLTTPFLWPEHGDDNFTDYWRFTEDGLRTLISQCREDPMDILEIRPTLPRSLSSNLIHDLRRLEVMDQSRRWPTGFMLKAHKR